MTAKQRKNAHEIKVMNHFPDTVGKSRLDLIQDEIQKFLLWDKIHSKNLKPDMSWRYFTRVQGHTIPFQTYNTGIELGLHGGQISIFSFTTPEKEKGVGIITGINSGDPEKQGELFWDFMDPEKGLINVHFVYWEAPGQEKDPDPEFKNRSIYDGSEMIAYRISFKLQRKNKKGSDKTVLLYDLKIVKEFWGRAAKEEIVSL